MIASLPMYDTPATAAANDRFWQAIRAAYGRGPVDLDRTQDPHRTWESEHLVLSQTCGLPYRSGLHRKVHLVGTPDYGVDGCPPGYYRSVIVARKDDPRVDCAAYADTRLARNDERSQSGWAALVAHFRHCASEPFAPSQILDTGSHAASAHAIAQGRADVAAIDAVTWAFLKRDSNATRDLKVLAQTVPTPGLPYIAALSEDADRLFTAISSALSQLSKEDRATLMLTGLVRIAPEDYLNVPMP